MIGTKTFLDSFDELRSKRFTFYFFLDLMELKETWERAHGDNDKVGNKSLRTRKKGMRTKRKRYDVEQVMTSRWRHHDVS